MDAKTWLDTHGVTNYTITEDGVDVEGDVDLSEKNLTSIDVQFNIVTGDFRCTLNQLTSLKGCPRSCEYFACFFNNLQNLVGGPETVRSSYDCSENALTSLLGAPRFITGQFCCDMNELKSLEGAPDLIVGHFFATYNELQNLEHLPRVDGCVWLHDNPDIQEFAEIRNSEIIREIITSRRESAALGTLITADRLPHTIKI